MITCCGQEMYQAGDILHCMVCKKTRLIVFPYGKDRQVLSERVVIFVQEYDPSWKEFKNVVHELWKEAHYDGYEAKLPDEWMSHVAQATTQGQRKKKENRNEEG